MQLISYLIPAVVLGLLNYFIIEDEKKPIKIFVSIVGCFIFLNIIVLEIFKLSSNMNNILDANTYNLEFTSKYILVSLIIGFIYLFLKGVASNKILLLKDEYKLSIPMKILKVLSIFFVAIGAIFVFFSNWFIDYFGNITPEQFLFNLKSPLKGTGGGMIDEILTTPVLSILATLVIAIIIISFSRNIYLVKDDDTKRKIIGKKLYNGLVTIITLVGMVCGVIYGSNKLQLGAVAKAYFANSNYVKDNYVDPRNAKMSFPAKKRNLIHIYLESMENSYLSKNEGGYMNQNLIPQLTQLSKEGYSFSHNNKFGGPNQTYGSSWSVASMVNMHTGIPLKIPMDGNSYGVNGTFLPGAINLGDILEAEGYEQTVMFGADADFGGLTTYYKTHGNYKIMDLKYARSHGLVPKDYKVWWGYEDEKLFKFAKDEIIRLSKTGKPFNFTMETADTHFPNGYLSPNAPRPYDKQYSNVLAFSDKQAAEFIRWIQHQPFYDNTTIVVTGDHLNMDKNYFKGWDPKFRRSIFNFILNPATDISKAQYKNREYAPLDFFPTILSSLGVKIQGDRLGMGTNLFSGKKTLVERDGVKKFNDELSINSRYYLNHFIDVKGTSVLNTKNITTRPGGTTPVPPHNQLPKSAQELSNMRNKSINAR